MDGAAADPQTAFDAQQEAADLNRAGAEMEWRGDSRGWAESEEQEEEAAGGGIKLSNKMACELFNASGNGEVQIPHGVTEIGGDAFLNCEILTSILIPNSVTKIGDCAFCHCHGLTSVQIPNSVTEFGGAFMKCHGLTSVKFEDGLTQIGEGAFFRCKGLTSVQIPSSVTKIGEEAFGACKGLTSVLISSATEIGKGAFHKSVQIVRLDEVDSQVHTDSQVVL